MKKLSRRLVSILLCIFMLAGLLPAGILASAVTPSDDDTIIFDFSKAYNNDEKDAKLEKYTSFNTGVNPNWTYFDMSDEFKALRNDAEAAGHSKRTNVFVDDALWLMKKYHQGPISFTMNPSTAGYTFLDIQDIYKTYGADGSFNSNWIYFDVNDEVKALGHTNTTERRAERKNQTLNAIYGGELQVSAYREQNLPTFAKDTDVWSAFKVRAPLDAGTYKLSVTTGRSKAFQQPATLEMYVAPFDSNVTDGDSYITDANRVYQKKWTSVDTGSGTTIFNADTLIESNEFTVSGGSDEYIVLFRVTNCNLTIKSFSLAKSKASSTEDDSADSLTEAWSALRVKPDKRGIYSLKFTKSEVTGNDDIYSGNPNVNIYFSEYVNGQNSGAYYMTSDNLIIDDAKIFDESTVAENIVVDAKREYVLIIDLLSDGGCAIKSINLTKTAENPLSLDISELDTVSGAPNGYKAVIIPGFEAFGVHYINLISKVIASDSPFSVYLAEYEGGTAESYITDENLIAENVTYTDGEAMIADAFTVKNSGKHILIVPDSVKKFEYDKTADLSYLYDLDSVGSNNIYKDFLRYGVPHDNWIYFDMCDDFKGLLEGKAPSSAPDATEQDIRDVALRMFSSAASGDNYLRIVSSFDRTGHPVKIRDAWGAIKIKSPDARGIYNMKINVPGKYSNANNVNVYVAHYDPAKTSGNDYITEENCVIKEKSFTSGVGEVSANGIVNDGSEEYVIIFKMNGWTTGNTELRVGDLTFTKTDDLPSEYTYDVTADEMEIPSPTNYGIYELSLKAKSGENLDGVEAYIAPKADGNVKTDANLATEKVFAAMKGTDKLSLHIENAEKVASVTLKKVENPKLSLILSDEKLVAGKETTATVTANGKQVLPWSISLTSSDESVAQIKESLTISAKKSGVVTISALVGSVLFDKTYETSVKKIVSGADIEALPENITASFQTEVIEADTPLVLNVSDESGNIINAGNVNITYEIADEDIVDFDGVYFTGKKPGHTTIKVRAEMAEDSRECEVAVKVVGKNLFTRVAGNGEGAVVSHGSFENGAISKPAESYTPPIDAKSLWIFDHNYLIKSSLRSYFFNYATEEGISPKYPGEKTNYMAIDYDWKYIKDAEEFHLVRFQTSTRTFDSLFSGKPNKGHLGYPQANKNKIYQFSGYFKVEEGSEFDATTNAYMRFRNDTRNSSVGDAKWATETVYLSKQGSSVPSEMIKPGEWIYFETPAVYANWDGLLEPLDGGEADVMWLEPYFDIGTSKSGKVKFYASDFAINEVAFDTLDFTYKGDFSKAKVYDTFATTVVPKTTTGDKITSGDTAKKFEVKYSTTNPRVAKVSNDGVITAVSNGSCEIYADMTIGDTTVRGIIPVEFSGLDIIFETVEGTISDSELLVGETAEITQEFFKTDGNPYIDDPENNDDNVRVYYESADVSIADVDQNGVVTGKGGGTTTIFVYAERGKVLAKDEITVTVIDDSPIASVKISGPNTVEKNFKIKLSASAINESGSATLIDTVNFDCADEESKAIIEISEDGTIRGLSVGEAKVIATVTSATGSEMTSSPFTIVVTEGSPSDMLIDFRLGPQGGGITTADFATDGYTVNETYTSDYLLEDSKSVKPNNFRWLPEGLFANVDKNVAGAGNVKATDVAFNIKIDYSGWYLPKFRGSFIKTGTDRADIYFNGEYIGHYNFYNPTLINPGEAKLLNPIYLEAGEDNVLIFRVTRSGPKGNDYMYMHSLELEYISDAPTIESVVVEAEKTTLALGETSRIDTIATLSTGAEYEFGFMHGYTNNAEYPDNKRNENAYVEYVSSDENVAKVVDGKIVAVGLGECTITSTAYYMGAEGITSNELKIAVSNEVLGSIEVTPSSVEALVGKSFPITVTGYLTNGDKVSSGDLEITYVSNDKAVAILNEKPMRVYTTGGGETTVTVSATLNETTLTYDIPVSVIGRGFATVNLSAFSQIMRPDTYGYDISVECLDANGEKLDASGATVTFESSDENVVKVSENGHMTPGELGTAEITATVDLDGVIRVGKMNVSVRAGKVERTYYTEEEIENARKNIKNYQWAEDAAKAEIKLADKYVDYADHLYEIMPSEGLPRSFATGYVGDPKAYHCRYCDADLMSLYDNYPWVIDALKDPWKVKCPECSRVFPSNDFGSFYELGKNEHGEFDLQYALNKHREKFLTQIEEEYGVIEEPGEEYTDSWYKYYGYGIKGGYLTNDLYSEITDTDPVTGDKINGKIWGVDNGWGYFTGRKYDNGVEEVHTYIPVFVHSGLWAKIGPGIRFEAAIHTALTSLANAYLYTGDKKYARAGAKLLDRLADFYPDYDPYSYRGKYQNSNQHGKSGGGKVLGNIWESSVTGPIYAVTYDAFFDIYEDEELLDYLTEKAIKYNQAEKLVDGRVTPEKLRSNVEKNILEQLLPEVIEGDIGGNFGFMQNVLIKAAIVLDDSTLTPEIIQFVMQSGDDALGTSQKCEGGNVFAQIMNIVDRDGFGNESSMGYNLIWAERLIDIARDLLEYSEIRPEYVKEEYNLFKNPKYIKMLQMHIPTAVSGATHANIGDSSDTGRRTEDSMIKGNMNLSLAGYEATGFPIFAQLLYSANGRTVRDLHGSIFESDPEAIQEEIEAAIEEHGEIDFTNSQLASGYGFASLISGDAYTDDLTNVAGNTLRTFWMYFGGGLGHKHADRFNLGIDAYKYDFAPEFGYPEETGSGGANLSSKWNAGTVSHNTVVVNDKKQDQVIRTAEADILHFDDSGDIHLMDADAPLTYYDVTDIYRRTVVTVDIDDEATYALDFFRIKGGDSHLYSFHSQSVDITFSDNLKFVEQPFGTYAGANIAYGDNKNYTANSGYNYLYNVKRAKNPGTGEFTADFKVEYLRIGATGPKDLGLKFTMLNNFNVSEVASAFGQPPQKGKNPKEFEYLLVKREGKDLDTLFTSVIEPYKGASKIAKTERVEVVRADGKEITESEPCAAVKVTLTNGRVDYIVYAANKNREYIISDGGEEMFRFRGFVGVYTKRETGEAARIYLHDGVMLDNGHEYAITDGSVLGAISGKVLDFTKDNAFESFIDIETTADVPAETLVGKIINVDTDDAQNGVYRIVSASKTDTGYRVSTGNVTLIRAMKEGVNGEISYIYNINRGAKFTIPLTEHTTTAPEVLTSDEKDEYFVSVGSLITIPITASSRVGLPLTYDTSGLPRGASFNEEEMVITWKPTMTQLGENVVSLTASDGTLEKTLYFTINVYGSVSGGGGGGGGDTPLPDKPKDEPKDEPTVEPDEPKDEPTTDEPVVDVPTEKGFRDLGNHAWAEDAINALAEEGIIKGTSDVTFAPQNNITRADYAILLVRAFELESENAENFADVSASDYFAKELAVARNTGIVGGIGDNKYAPRNTITRQDMMVILYRALVKMGIELKPIEGFDVTSFADYNDVADYARDAVKALVEVGLVNGKGDKLAGSDFTTRAEVAVLLKRVLDYIA